MITLTIVPEGEFSLDAASHFGFGPNTGRPSTENGRMTLTFATDDRVNSARVDLEQSADGVVTAEVASAASLAVVEAQVRRILSLDHSGTDWAAVGERDAVVGRMQRSHPGLRPVLFHSPYEAAAWSIISTRRARAQATVVRSRISRDFGTAFERHGETTYAFPTPEQLLSMREVQGLDETRIGRLHAIADAELNDRLTPGRLLALETDEALAELQTLPGIGPTYSMLILLRSTGTTDTLTGFEPRIASYIARLYNLGHDPATPEEILEIAEHWRPFRTWTSVLTRVAGEALGLPVPANPSFGRRVRA
jgi:DNA-3-methyladenine glycosylase II